MSKPPAIGKPKGLLRKIIIVVVAVFCVIQLAIVAKMFIRWQGAKEPAAVEKKSAQPTSP